MRRGKGVTWEVIWVWRTWLWICLGIRGLVGAQALQALPEPLTWNKFASGSVSRK